ncbi:VOC family protein [Alicyclobacillus mali]|uniref:VOC family protein n=1 Tax=Alicyclobacillus mali (ex Roth et al. 2021) TaxID=1123961 RepID=A0ABS0F5I9_9BACL|nr:VOC family protein [Alicyclobacillus mali (ex Roth et al. 2021)]MBF8378554.1 VOC family protein [Alicyclobacillus mali (ex Roth et al. 2021)]MCL6487931.1 VOC family protein [Alicyclobacillus mali (ex Roth et al. 2021)]
MEAYPLETRRVAQIGIIVRDIEAASAAWAKLLGCDVPKWHWTEAYEQARTEYQGQPTQARAKLAFFHLDNLDIELIEPDEHPSTWRAWLDEHGESVHHIAFEVDGMAAHTESMTQAGLPLLQRGEYTGGRYAYFDGASSARAVIELLENDRR